MLRNIEPRLYQETIFGTAALKNTLIVLPTGLGKTAIGLMLAEQRLKQHPEGKILFLAPTKPLCLQHLTTFKKHLALPEENFAVFTGEISPQKRGALWKSIQLIFATPQGIENDLVVGRLSLKDVVLIVFDEAHRATGDYSYVWLAKKYREQAEWPHIVALTASPGSDLQKIRDVCGNLFIEAVEIRTPQDEDVAPYVQPVDVQLEKVRLTPEFKQVQTPLIKCLEHVLAHIKKFGLANKINVRSKKDLLQLQRELHARLAGGDKDFQVLKTIGSLAQAIKVQHAVELLETQGLAPLQAYLERLEAEHGAKKSKAILAIWNNPQFQQARALARSLFEKGVEHPKLARLHALIAAELAENKTSKIMVFTQYRDSALRIKKELEHVDNALAEIFVGQAKKSGTGLSQKQQAELIDQFRDGLFNVLICTSVAEEGLDIPAVDIVMFYEPIPSAIRTIQRRGRTGRQKKGRVIILMTEGTRDTGFHFSAIAKERAMHRALGNLRQQLQHAWPQEQQQKNNPNDTGTQHASHENPSHQSTQSSTANNQTSHSQSQTTLAAPRLKVFVDSRESGGAVIKHLADNGAAIEMRMLGCADYVLSDRCAVELKKYDDFVQSIVDGRLLDQAGALIASYERAILILEGEPNSMRAVDPRAVRGALAAIALGYGITVLPSRNPKETAALLLALAAREQGIGNGNTAFNPHARKPATRAAQQEYLISSLPSVGPGLAKKLLEHFGSADAALKASEAELRAVPGVGQKIAKAIKELLEAQYGNGNS